MPKKLLNAPIVPNRHFSRGVSAHKPSIVQRWCAQHFSPVAKALGQNNRQYRAKLSMYASHFRRKRHLPGHQKQFLSHRIAMHYEPRMPGSCTRGLCVMSQRRYTFWLELPCYCARKPYNQPGSHTQPLLGRVTHAFASRRCFAAVTE